MSVGQTVTVGSLLLSLVCQAQGLGPAYGGDQFVRIKEIPPALVAARESGSLSLVCSVTGSPTPTVGWYKEGVLLAGTKASPGGLGETWAKLYLPCLTQEDAGLYECRGGDTGREVSVTTKLEVVRHNPHSGCQPSGKADAPSITGWYSTVMMESGETARLSCNVQDTTERVSVVWRDANGDPVKTEGRYKVEGTDLVISEASWADMGRFTCTVQNGFGVDMVSSFLYPLAPAFLQ